MPQQIIPLPTFRYFFMIVTLACLPLLASSQTAQPMKSDKPWLQQKLKELQWKKRVVLLITASNEQADLQEQRAIFLKEKIGMQQRDIKVIEVQPSQLSDSDKEFIDKKLDALKQAFTALLIGKDGGVKVASNTPIAAEKLFATIDAMPMRQQEMKH